MGLPSALASSYGNVSYFGQTMFVILAYCSLWSCSVRSFHDCVSREILPVKIDARAKCKQIEEKAKSTSYRLQRIYTRGLIRTEGGQPAENAPCPRNYILAKGFEVHVRSYPFTLHTHQRRGLAEDMSIRCPYPTCIIARSGFNVCRHGT